MQINPGGPTTRTVDYYDFAFTSGTVLPLTVCEADGDTILISPSTITISLTARKNSMNPDVSYDAETFTLFTSQVSWMRHTKKEVAVLTPEQEFEWKKTVQELGGKVN